MPARTHAVPTKSRHTAYSHTLTGGGPPARQERPPAARVVRWVVLLLVLALTAFSLEAAFGGDAGAVDVAVQCGPTSVGIATECTATITLAGGTAGSEATGSFPVKVGAYDNEQGGQPSTAQAVARAQQFDHITAGAHQYRANVAAMRSANPNLILDAYVNGTHTRKTDLPEAQYCHDAAGARIVTNGVWSGNILMNPTNAGWRTTLLDGVNTSLAQSGYDGVFLDVLGRGALLYNVSGHCIDPRTGLAYKTADWERDTSELARSIKERSARPVVANGASRGAIYFSPPPSSVIAQFADGGLAEGFTRNGAFFEGYYTESQLLKDVAMVADGPVMHVLTKDWRSVTQEVKDREMRYAFATFLLGTDGNDVFGWTGSQGTLTQFDPLWDTDLGAPRGPYYAVGSGRYRRDFVRGHALVDTVSHTGSIVVAPSGDHTVTWSSSGDGTFESSRCTSDGGSTTTCQVRYTPSAGSSGPHTITETGTTSILVSRRQSTTAVSCGTPVTLPAPSTCTVTVTDVSGGSAVAPTGEVTFAAAGDGAFNPPRCSLMPRSGSSSSCSVTYAPTTAGGHGVTATFPSDLDHQASSSLAPAVITVAPAIVTDVTSPVVQIVSPADGTAIKKGKTIRVVATATDDVDVTRVDVAADGVVMCSDVETTSMTCAWSVPRNGSTGFVVTVTAWDAAGNTAAQRITVRVTAGRA
jgi:Hypothetical glycosyl hydrolase family 15/Bacterial Ig domain